MSRLRKVKKYGNTWIISLTTSDVKDFNLKIGMEVDIDNLIFKKEKKKNDSI